MNIDRSVCFLTGRSDRINQLAHISLLDSKDNTGVGVNTAHVQGAENTAVGAYTGTLSAASVQSVLLGAHAGARTVHTTQTVAVGARALSNTASAHHCVFVGFGSGADSRSASWVTALGHGSAGRLSTCVRSTFVGGYSAQFVFNSVDDTFVGFSSGRTCVEGARNACVGAFCGSGMERGSENVLVGFRTGANVVSAHRSVAIGAFALENAQHCSNVVAIGTDAGRFAQGARDAVFIGGGGGGGGGAPTANSVFVGVGTGSAGEDNVALGVRALPSVRGSRNTGVGSGAGGLVSTGNANTLVGAFAGTRVAHHDENVCVGVLSGAEGHRNVALGFGAGSFATGNSCCIIGWNAGNVASGDHNVMVGSSIAHDADGSFNVLIGTASAQTVRGDNNCVVASRGVAALTGNNNVMVGSLLDVKVPVENNVLIGSNAVGEYGFNGLRNSVILGNDLSLSNRDSDTLILSTSGLGEVMRANASMVSFSAGVRRVKTSLVPKGPDQTFVIDSYQEPTIEYNTYSDVGSLWGPTGLVLQDLYERQIQFEPSWLSSQTTLHTINTYYPKWTCSPIPVVRIQQCEYTHVFFHSSGLCCFSNPQLFNPALDSEDAIRDAMGTATHGIPTGNSPRSCLFGPTISFGPSSGQVLMLHAATMSNMPTNDAALEEAGFTAASAIVLRWEGLVGSWQPTPLIVEITIFYLEDGLENAFKVVWFPGDLRIGMYNSTIHFLGLDGCVLGEWYTYSNQQHNALYFFPRSEPRTFSPWVAMTTHAPNVTHTRVPLKRALKLFGETVTFVDVDGCGRVVIGQALAVLDVVGPVLAIDAYPVVPYTHFVSMLLSASQLHPDGSWDTTALADDPDTTVIRIERMQLKDGAMTPHIFEVWCSPTSLSIVFTSTFQNAPSNIPFTFVYRGVTYNIPRMFAGSYTVSTDLLPPHVFGGGKVVIDTNGITLSNAQFAGDGGLLSNISATSLVWPGQVGSGVLNVAGQSPSGGTHFIDPTAIIDKSYVGTLDVYAYGPEREGHVTMSVVRRKSPKAFDVTNVSTRYTSLSVFSATETFDQPTGGDVAGIRVVTEPECSLTWQFRGASYDA